MLTYIRNIRRSLVESGSFQKYLIYATGEIILVVLGILIALQINYLNEERKDQIRLSKHYFELKNELIIDRNNLEDILENVRMIDKRTYEIYEFINSNDELLDTTRLVEAFLEAEPYAFFSISQASYSNLVSSGDIQLIKNAQLKTLLGIYHDNTNWNWTAHNGNLKKAIEEYSFYVHKFIHPLTFRNRYITGFSEYLRNESFDSNNGSYSTITDWGIIKKDKEFSAILSHLLQYRIFQLYFYNEQMQQINDIIELIDTENK